MMDIRYFLDWCPVSALPVHNRLWKSDGLTKKSASTLPEPHAGPLSSLFIRYPQLLMFEYAMRLDGLFIFRIGLRPYTESVVANELSNALSDLIKELTGHKHDFHIYPFTKVTNPSKGWNKVYYYCSFYFQSAFQFLCLSSSHLKDQLDIDLHIRPVEIENPFDEEFKEKSHKNFNALCQLVDPSSGDSSVAQLRALESKGIDQRACLRLRSLFAGKKERCLIAYQRRDRLKRFEILSVIYGALFGLFVFYLIGIYTELGDKTASSISFVAGLGAFIFLDDRLQAPKIEVIQRALGFYAYANIYSSITETMYRDSCRGPHFNDQTGNFDNLIEALKARLDLERQTIANRKYLWTIIFSLIATLFALTKLSIELERISDTPTINEEIDKIEYYAGSNTQNKIDPDMLSGSNISIKERKSH